MAATYNIQVSVALMDCLLDCLPDRLGWQLPAPGVDHGHFLLGGLALQCRHRVAVVEERQVHEGTLVSTASRHATDAIALAFAARCRDLGYPILETSTTATAL